LDFKTVVLYELVKTLNFGNMTLNMKYIISEEYPYCILKVHKYRHTWIIK